jgi:hypothetical protein
VALFAVICVLSCGFPGSAQARSRSVPSTPPPIWSVLSPDGRHHIDLTASGRLQLDGRPLALANKPLARPVWRHDSRALAFLQRSSTGLQLLVVLLDVEPLVPIVWPLPPLMNSRLRQVFWIDPQRVGIGEKMLVPNLVVSWTTVLV